MRRRAFISLLGGAAAWPLGARAEQSERLRQIAVLMNLAEGDREGLARLAAFKQALEELGWVDGRNVRFDIRWGAGNDERYRMLAKELVAFSPDVTLGAAGSTVPALLRATRTVPIVFTQTPEHPHCRLSTRPSCPSPPTGLLATEQTLRAAGKDYSPSNS
jgi:putative ABC transport system substrate-binding protein